MPSIPYLKTSELYGEVVNWTPYIKPKFRIKRLVKYVEPANEALENLLEYYRLKGLVAPPGEVEACKQFLEPAQLCVSAPLKPVYGTPEFWKDYWKKKKGLVGKDKP